MSQPPFTIAAFAFAGVALGAAHLAALRANLALYLGRRPLALALLLHIARLVTIATALRLAVLHGAGALLVLLAGFTLASLVGVYVRARARELPR